jgi:RNA polymerase sigma factor (sigma-70 family)
VLEFVTELFSLADLLPQISRFLAEVVERFRELAEATWFELLQHYPDEALALVVQDRRAARDEAFQELMLHRGREKELRHYFRKHAASSDIEDLTQEVMVGVLKMETYDALAGKFCPYLWGIARYVRNRYWREQGKHRRPPVPPPPEGIFDAPPIEVAEEVQKCLDDMPDSLREVMQDYLDGKPTKDTATKLVIQAAQVYRKRYLAWAWIEGWRKDRDET